MKTILASLFLDASARKLLTPKGYHNAVQDGTRRTLSTPKGYHNKAQGKRSVALGENGANLTHPERAAQLTAISQLILCNPFRVEFAVCHCPRVARTDNPGLRCQTPFGVKTRSRENQP